MRQYCFMALAFAARSTDACNAALQGRFAEGLASCINSRLGPHEQHEQQQEYERRAAQVEEYARVLQFI